ncbi:type IV secretion system protein VirB10 [Achromobacter spanius]|uniref:type IV secretion system protein VirB10 n=1 Tax=Achromobacter spanius TaxID=217203 RepID=UPI0037F5758D
MNIKQLFNRGRDKAADSNDTAASAAQTAEDHVGAGLPIPENEGLPSVNKRGNGRLGKRLGGIGLAIVGAYALYAVNKPQGEVVEKGREKEVVATSSMPPLNAPPPRAYAPPPPLAAPAQAPKDTHASVNPGGGARSKTVEWYDRKRQGKSGVNGGGSGGGGGGDAQGVDSRADTRQAPSGKGGGLASKLEVTSMAGVSAAMLPNRNFLITQGNGIVCTLETAVASTQPGMTTCVGATDVFSANGHVNLLPRGTRYTGQYEAGIKAGQARLFMVWHRAETPDGVVINLNSPGTDSLGRAGADGWVDNHFAERFGAAFLSTLLTSSLDYLVAGQQSGASTVVSDSAQSGSRVAEKILDSTINIPPTLHKNQGDDLRIMVARDLDFSSVYSLRVR